MPLYSKQTILALPFCFLGRLLFIPTFAQSENEFINPPSSGSQDVTWNAGYPQLIRWNTNYTGYAVKLMELEGATKSMIWDASYEFVEPSQSFTWEVGQDSDYTDMGTSNPYIFSLFPPNDNETIDSAIFYMVYNSSATSSSSSTVSPPPFSTNLPSAVVDPTTSSVSGSPATSSRPTSVSAKISITPPATISPSITPSTPPASSTKKTTLGVGIGVGIGAALVLGALSATLFMCLKRKRTRRGGEATEASNHHDQPEKLADSNLQQVEYQNTHPLFVSELPQNPYTTGITELPQSPHDTTDVVKLPVHRDPAELSQG
ncbi:hypothetical protein MMC14_006861 [Varicellaria rhodocarpa]|nr:hypothetical protein [Varicellaria rhodocarpa]